MVFRRLAVYFVPPPGELAAFGARWLGWDPEHGRPVPDRDTDTRVAIVATPRRYGLHATLAPPFLPAAQADPASVRRALAELARTVEPPQVAGLRLARLGRFLALEPVGDTGAVDRLAQRCLEAVDAFRAPLDAATLARRDRPGLTVRQRSLLERWGYPFVEEEFRFHITLTGRMPRADLLRWERALADRLPALPEPFRVPDIALVGERADGFFVVIERFALTAGRGAP